MTPGPTMTPRCLPSSVMKFVLPSRRSNSALYGLPATLNGYQMGL
jgi:hypothetical protein